MVNKADDGAAVVVLDELDEPGEVDKLDGAGAGRADVDEAEPAANPTP
jgi:hypothetical protein